MIWLSHKLCYCYSCTSAAHISVQSVTNMNHPHKKIRSDKKKIWIEHRVTSRKHRNSHNSLFILYSSPWVVKCWLWLAAFRNTVSALLPSFPLVCYVMNEWMHRLDLQTVASTIKISCYNLFFFLIFLTGINKQIAVDAAYFPVVRSNEPRAVGLLQDPHGNTMLSCLSSGFLCPLSDTEDNSDASLPAPGSQRTNTQEAQFVSTRIFPAEPWSLSPLAHVTMFSISVTGDATMSNMCLAEEILMTASELEDTHMVCILDLCHLGGDKVEILINKVYRVTEVSLD